MRKESKEMAVTAATMKKEKRNEPAATTFVNYLESWYQNKCLSNSTSSSTDAYYHWMIFNVIEPNLPDKERAVDDIDAEYLNALLARIDRKNENMAASAYRFLRVFIKDSFEPDTGDYELFFQIKKYSGTAYLLFISCKERQHLPLSGICPGALLWAETRRNPWT